MSTGTKPLAVVVKETVVLSMVGVGSIIGLLTERLSSDAVTAVWGLILGYGFANGYRYVNNRGEVISGGAPPQSAPRFGPE